MNSVRTALHRRLAESVFLSAQKDVLTGQIARRPAALIVANLLSLAILATPVLMALGGAVLILAAWPNLIALAGGAVLIWAGVWLRPRKPRPPSPVLHRSDLPRTFSLLDEICRRLDAPRIESLYVYNDFNAFLFNSKTSSVLGIGTFLWLALTDEERIAVLAHEVAHLVNNDVSRKGLIFAAFQTIDGWVHLASPIGIVNYETQTILEDHGDNLAQDIVSTVLHGLFTGIQRVLTGLTYIEQQRAEYLADSMASAVAGRSAVVSLLEKLECNEDLERSHLEHHVTRRTDGAALLKDIGLRLTEVPAEVKAQRIRNALEQGSAIDSDHPPTGYRIAFLESLPKGAHCPGDLRALALGLDMEWETVIREMGERFVAEFEIQ